MQLQNTNDPAADPLAHDLDSLVEERPLRKRSRRPGLSARSLRVREWRYLTGLEIAKDYAMKHGGAKIPPDELEAAVDEAYEALSKDPDWDLYKRFFAETAPTCRAPLGTDPTVEMAALRRLPEIRWLARYMQTKTNRRGKPTRKTPLTALFFELAFGQGRPEVSRVRYALEGNTPLLNWAHGYPGKLPGKSQLYDALHSMLRSTLLSADALVAVNIELIKRLAKLKDADGTPRHPLVGRHLAVDGTLIPAAVQQRAPIDWRHKEILHGARRRMVNTVIYTRRGKQVSKHNTGYRLTVLVDIASTLPVAFRLDEATADERSALTALLGDLFEGWPDAPVETISGDSLFENSKELAMHLVFGWGIQPIFPERAGEFARHLSHADNLGVPKCACGEMKVRNREGFYDVARRRKHGFRPGELLDKRRQRGARIRWECPTGRCKDVTTRPADDPRLYTYYPRTGRDRLAVMRRVLASRREAVESVFAALKRRGCGAAGFDRPAWVYDDEAHWFHYGGLLGLTARRLAHELGLYEAAYREAEDLDLLAQPTRNRPAPGPTADELADVVTRRRLEPIQAPVGWPSYEEIPVARDDDYDEMTAAYPDR